MGMFICSCAHQQLATCDWEKRYEPIAAMPMAMRNPKIKNCLFTHLPLCYFFSYLAAMYITQLPNVIPGWLDHMIPVLPVR
jgi:hypothetical protein